MRFINFCLGICLFLILTPTLAQDNLPSFESSECPFDTSEGQTVECGYLTVPEDRSQPDGATIRLPVAIFRSPNPDKAPDPIIYLEGGPGGDALETVPLLFNLRFAPLLENRDLIMFDQRGTGYAEPSLACPELTQFGLDILDENISPEESNQLMTEVLLQCRERLVGEGVNLAAYNSPENAADVNDIRLVLGYDEWNLWGVSYGTRLAQTIMRDYPEGIRTVVLDSVYPLQANLYTSIATNAGRAFDMLFAGCAADPACNTAYPDLEESFKQLVAQLDENPVMLSVTNPLDGQTYDALVNGDGLVSIVFQSFYVPELITLLPQIVADGLDGNYDILAQVLGAFLTNSDFFSVGMQLSVQCYDEITFTTEEELAAGLEDFPLLRNFLEASPTLGPGIIDLCDAWGAGEADPIENEPIRSTIPTLILAGEYDPITPPEWGRQVNELLVNSDFFELPGQGHGPSLQNACAVEVLLEFVNDPTKTPDAACIDNMTAPAFAVRSEEPAAITLVPVTNDDFGVSGLVPDGWEEIAPGIYRRASSAIDPTLIIQQVAPGTDAAGLVELLGSQLNMEIPNSVGSRDANGFAWELYWFETQGVAIDLAVTDRDGTGYLVMLQSTPNERDMLYESVFLPAVDALTPV